MAPVRNDLAVYDRQVDAWWDDDDPTFAPLHALAPARLAYFDRMGAEFGGMRVLDVGCGGGYVSEALAARGAEVVGIDLARGALVAAKAHAEARGDGRPAYLRALGDKLPFASRSFDAAVCTDVLVHVPDPAAVVGEVGRVLRPGGRLFFSSINRSRLSAFVMITLGEDLLRIVHRGTHDPARFIRPSELRAMCEAAGLDVLHTEGLGPRWVGWDGRLRFGRLPTRAVMYQGIAARRPTSS